MARNSTKGKKRKYPKVKIEYNPFVGIHIGPKAMEAFEQAVKEVYLKNNNNGNTQSTKNTEDSF